VKRLRRNITPVVVPKKGPNTGLSFNEPEKAARAAQIAANTPEPIFGTKNRDRASVRMRSLNSARMDSRRSCALGWSACLTTSANTRRSAGDMRASWRSLSR
jgi:hypothetical protein